mgnify:CR=1 FL=1
MEQQATILIVDDDREIRTLLADYLESHGYTSQIAADGHAMWAILDKHPIDLLVLDLNLPGEDGLTLCRNLRAKSNLPVIMLTARGEPLDRILGLEMGADDYLPKPFEPRELLARIRSVLRRAQANPNGHGDSTPQKIRFGEDLRALVGGRKMASLRRGCQAFLVQERLNPEHIRFDLAIVTPGLGRLWQLDYRVGVA